MIYKPKGRRYYMLKFMWRGQLIRKSTRATSAKDARSIEGKVRSELARGNWDVLEPKPAPTLAEFLRKDFLPFTKSKCAERPATVRYYAVGIKSLLSSDLAGVTIDKVTDQHAGQYAARHSHLSPSTVNCGLRTLRRALYLAAEWGKLNRKPKITLAKGERQRDRVLTDVEIELYLEACPQPWRDAATVMLGTGMRPGEVFLLRWENILLKGGGGLLQITNGKSKAARRMLPLVPAVYSTLKARQNGGEGWVFPAATESGHLEGGSAKNYHARALAAIKKAAADKKIDNPLKPFPPYTMRHTALTRLADAGCDAFTLARIAGHSSITITQRYCHPQADAIERAFAKVADGEVVVTDGGQHGTRSGLQQGQLTAAK
jgi:integrase